MPILIALGMVAETQWAESQGECTGISAQITDALTKLGLPTDWETREIDLDALEKDKKRFGDEVNLPCVPTLGSFEIKKVPISQIVEYVRLRRLA